MLPTPYPYQKPILDQIEAALKTHDKVILAACPASGKTIMGLTTAMGFVARNESVLILTHNQNNLMDQWHDDMKEFGIVEPKIVVAIPSGCTEDGLKPSMETAINEAGVPVGLLIVDEAHEYYFAERLIPNIKKFTQPRKELLLTGTPSPFILANDLAKEEGSPEPYKIIFFSGLDAYLAGQLQDTYFGVVRSTYKIDEEFYTESNEVSDRFVFTARATSQTVDLFVEAMVERLKGAYRTSPSTTALLGLTGINRVLNAFRLLDKTLIAARNAKQAFDVRDALARKGVTALVSECQEDADSLEITKFKEDPTVNVLIVVRRATLGFNMRTLCNVIDLRCSRNIDVIYQLYARVLRKHPTGKDKFYFRVTNYFNSAVDSYYLQAALCLSNPDFFSKYNGKNLAKMEVLVKKPKSSNEPGEPSVDPDGSEDDSNEPDDNTRPIAVNDEILGLKLMSEAFLNAHSPIWNEVEYCRFGDVMRKLTGKVFFNEDWQERFEVCKAFYAQHGRPPSGTANEREEKSIGMWLASNCSPSSDSYHPEVRAWRDSIGSRFTLWQERFEQYKAFYTQHGRLPSATAKDKEEKSLSFWLNKAYKMYPEVRAWRDSIRSRFTLWQDRFEVCKAFYALHGKMPNQHAKDKEEKSLGGWLNKAYKMYPEVRAWRDSIIRPVLFTPWQARFEQCKAFYAKHGRFPSGRTKTKDVEEKSLGTWLVKTCSPSNRCHHPEVRAWRDEIKKSK